MYSIRRRKINEIKLSRRMKTELKLIISGTYELHSHKTWNCTIWAPYMSSLSRCNDTTIWFAIWITRHNGNRGMSVLEFFDLFFFISRYLDDCLVFIIVRFKHFTSSDTHSPVDAIPKNRLLILIHSHAPNLF